MLLADAAGLSAADTLRHSLIGGLVDKQAAVRL
jgi:hypothetical protein